MRCLVNTADESELPSQAVTVFAWSSKKHAVLYYPDGILCIFCWLIPDVFRRVLLSVGLIGTVLVGINRLVFWKELIIEDSLPIPAYTQITFFGWRPAFGVVGGCWFHLPHHLFRSTLLHSIHLSSPVTICFKNGTFSLCFSKELHAEIWSRRFF